MSGKQQRAKELANTIIKCLKNIKIHHDKMSEDEYFLKGAEQISIGYNFKTGQLGIVLLDDEGYPMEAIDEIGRMR